MRGTRNKTLEEIAQAEDSNDDDYDDAAPGPSKHRHSRRGAPKGVRRKPWRGYKGSDVDSDSEEVLSDDSGSFGESEDEEVETNENGRPVRNSVKKAITYEEGSSDEDDELIEDDPKPRSSRPRTPRKSELKITFKVDSEKLSKMVNRPARSTRTGSRQSTQPPGPPARRSSRISHDEDEPLVALTNSGNHVQEVREGSRGPEPASSRPTRGGKGLKHPSKSTIDEDTEPNSHDTKEAEDYEVKASQHEVADSDPQTQAEPDATELPRLISDLQKEAAVEPESPDPLQNQNPRISINDVEDEEEDDEKPVLRGRTTRAANKRKADSDPPESPQGPVKRLRRNLRSANASGSRRRRTNEESSDFDPAEEQEKDEQLSGSSESEPAQRKRSARYDDSSSNGGRRSTRLRRSRNASRQASVPSEGEDELAAEIAELKRDGRKPKPAREEITYEPRGRRGGAKPNYNLLRIAPLEEEEEVAAPSPSQQRGRGRPGAGSWQRSLFNTYGPFGGAGGPAPVLGGGIAPRAQGDVDSDSSDDEVMKQPRPQVGGAVGMTPTTAGPAGGFNLFPGLGGADQAPAGTPANLGKVKDKQALADADPLGVDQNVTFDGVGGLQGHIDQLKEMVALPLLYPEIFMRFKITPPRGVLFHGPPGTGKTLLARALASSVSSQGRKVTFYMRKGADALSKWVGEAERQLRLLFEEARKNQPSIIFFDEIDGLAPVRSSKQEQIHASIVSTLLALMDGMDGRGQVIVIGATNRPDSIDPALRRPGRFDREFYFPLPNTEARKAIIDIHTKGWSPPLAPDVKVELAKLTKGYGGADLRALCTEAALNAVQRRYPQIYSSNEKLLIDPTTIEVTPKDFMLSVKKMVPSSERSASSGAATLPPSVAPLLQRPLDKIIKIVDDIMPRKKITTALEEAQFEDTSEGQSFGRERMQQAFETSRVFRPRMLVHGRTGMGQQYLAAALLNHFEGFHVQNLDLSTLYGDTTSSPEATIIRLFSEVKTHKPSVIYIPNVQEWYRMLAATTALPTFIGLLRSIKPTDPILVLGIAETDDVLDAGLAQDMFGYASRNRFAVQQPEYEEIVRFFEPVKEYVSTAPDRFPDPTKRKPRMIEKLPVAPPEPAKPEPVLSKEELRLQKKRDRQTLNMLKIRLQPIMDQIRTRYKMFRNGVIDDSQIRYLYDEADPTTVTSDLPVEIQSQATFRPFEKGTDAHGVPGLVEQATDKFFYNLDSVTIEKRLSNGYYKRPKDFLFDISRFAKDAKMIGDDNRLIKANELLANVEVDIDGIEAQEPLLVAACEKMFQREQVREQELIAKQKAEAANKDMPPPRLTSNVPPNGASVTTDSTVGPIRLGIPIAPSGPDLLATFNPTTPSRSTTSALTNGIHKDTSATNTGERTNGTVSTEGHKADVDDDTPMGEAGESAPTSGEKNNETPQTNSSSFNGHASAQPRHYYQYTAPSQQMQEAAGMSNPLSQTAGITSMRQGSQAADYHNSASTTDTPVEKKNSGDKTSGASNDNNRLTQDSGPNFFPYDETLGRDLPATQEPPHSQRLHTADDNHSPLERIQPASAPTVPLFNDVEPSPQRPVAQSQPQQGAQAQVRRPSTHIQDILNPSPEEPEHKLVLPSDEVLSQAIEQLAKNCATMTVEQMEQTNSVVMDVIWKTREEWDRQKVLARVLEAAAEVRADMHDVTQVPLDLPRSSDGSY
ncbi:Tat-binding-like protein [Cyphellophora attinorum]|uniref:Tat-binding-like protein n=1 Tax=Cyphellophora attinorum TaxID=1664694 RepID=A0A0N0NR92_9EURO|nr:Tat-binding-like protein [Phialophora attinorum]KPI44821.1 Tat-binding-like protein [Phialophora attinorum]